MTKVFRAMYRIRIGSSFWILVNLVISFFVSDNCKSAKQLLDNSHLADEATTDTEEYIVKPLKISPLPLNHHDIINERLLNNDNQSK